jgi:hypothetical protein
MSIAKDKAPPNSNATAPPGGKPVARENVCIAVSPDR